MVNHRNYFFFKMIDHKNGTTIDQKNFSAAGAEKNAPQAQKINQNARDRRAFARAVQKHYSLPWSVTMMSQNRRYENRHNFGPLSEIMGINLFPKCVCGGI